MGQEFFIGKGTVIDIAWNFRGSGDVQFSPDPDGYHVVMVIQDINPGVGDGWTAPGFPAELCWMIPGLLLVR